MRWRRFPQLGEKVARGSKTSITVPLAQGGRRFALHFFFEKQPTDAGGDGQGIAELAEKSGPPWRRECPTNAIAWFHRWC